MSRIEFMNRLAALLQDISMEEREEALQFYSNYFDDAGPENEIHVVAELGSPQKVAEIIKAGLKGEDNSSSEYSETGYTDTRFENKEPLMNKRRVHYREKYNNEAPKTSKIVKILLIIAIVFVGLPVILPLATGLVAVLFALLLILVAVVASLTISAFAIMVAGIIVFFAGIIKIVVAVPAAFLMMGIGLLLFTLGILGTTLMVKFIIVIIPGIFHGIVWLCRRPFAEKVVA